MRKQKGITLLSLAITIVVLLILVGTFTYNIDSYVHNKRRGDITADLQRINEKVQNYYARNKQLPVLNKYTNIENIKNVISSNDNSNYYVVDLDKIGGIEELSLIYGKAGFKQVRNKDIKEEITNITDVFIVNEQSHVIYYPQGVEAFDEVIYKLNEDTSKVQDAIRDIIIDGSWNENKKVNTPKIEGTGLTAIYWDENGNEIELTREKKATEWSNWYDYKAGTGTQDNTSSKWANAILTKDGVDSYFVWIPRYAYKITYYTDETKTTVSNTNVGYGSIDVKFIKGTGTTAGDGTVCKYADDSSLTSNDYIIHPAFTSNADLGGGFGELEGLWIGKFETSRSDADATNIGESTTLKVAPSVKSWVSTKIGDMYTYAKEYDTHLKSHMLKNSEWGAVAYLTHSKYGRNGNEIAVNQCSDKITGAGLGIGDSNIYNNIYSYDADNFETTYSYTSEQGKKASTTGNEYGIYDMSGGAWEYVASYYNKSTYNPSRYEEYASSFAGSGSTSNKYSTVYIGTTESSHIKGDSTSEISGWESDYNANFVSSDNPFFKYGGNYDHEYNSGIFSYSNGTGNAGKNHSFRTCLVVK